LRDKLATMNDVEQKGEKDEEGKESRL